MKTILNRAPGEALQPITDLSELTPLAQVWLPIEVTGEHRAMMGDELVVEVIDAVAIDAMVREAWLDEADPDWPGILVDNDHLSHDLAHPTEAKAWTKRLENRDGQLYGLIEVTDTGAAAIRNKRWKFFSTEYSEPWIEDLGKGPDGLRRVRPKKLTGLSLTNRPNHRGQSPITNREAEAAEQPTQYDKPMNKIAEQLGLPDTATEDDITAAIASLLERAAKADEMETETEVEEILNRHTNRIAEGTRDKWKGRLIANRATTEEILSDLPVITKAAAEVKPAITNRETAQVPDVSRVSGDETVETDRKTAAAIRNRAAEISKTQGLNHPRAWAAAQAEFAK
jgi:hypothetical protein